MQKIGDQLKALRKQANVSVREMAAELGIPNHSGYSYYEGPRFKGWLEVEFARRVADILARKGVEPGRVLALAGLQEQEVENEEALARVRRIAPMTFVSLPVRLPSEASLTRMFDGMFQAAGREDLSDELAQRLAQLLPAALGATPVDDDPPRRTMFDDMPLGEPARSPAKANRDSQR